MVNQIYRRLTATPEMLKLFDDEAMIQAMLDFERGVAEAEAKCDIFNLSVASTISDVCEVSNFSIPDLSERSVQHGTIVVPLVQELSKLVSIENEAASSWVHFGATSQDVIDTAMVMQLKKACVIMEKDVKRIISGLEELEKKYGNQIMIARTLMQPSVPIKFGQKISGWKFSTLRNWKRIERCASEALVLQLGGAGGNLLSLGTKGARVKEKLSEILDLPPPVDTWHVTRDWLVELCSSVTILVGGLGKMALDLSLLMQFEVGEVSEQSGSDRGRSSAMPHKRNPVACLIALTAAKKAPHLQAVLFGAMLQEHERALGGWQSEWLTIPSIFEVASGSASAMADLCNRLDIHTDKMERNLHTLKGLFMSERLMMALSKKIGKQRAREIVEEACLKTQSQDKNLDEILKSDKRVTAEMSFDELNRLMDVHEYVGLKSTTD